MAGRHDLRLPLVNVGLGCLHGADGLAEKRLPGLSHSQL